MFLSHFFFLLSIIISSVSVLSMYRSVYKAVGHRVILIITIFLNRCYLCGNSCFYLYLRWLINCNRGTCRWLKVGFGWTGGRSLCFNFRGNFSESKFFFHKRCKVFFWHFGFVCKPDASKNWLLGLGVCDLRIVWLHFVKQVLWINFFWCCCFRIFFLRCLAFAFCLARNSVELFIVEKFIFCPHFSEKIYHVINLGPLF